MVYITQTALTTTIKRTSGGYGYDHLQDRAKALVERKEWIDEDLEPDVCVRFHSYIMKRGLGNGNSSYPQAWRSTEWLC